MGWTTSLRISKGSRIILAILAIGLWPWGLAGAQESTAGHDKPVSAPRIIPRGPDDVSARLDHDVQPKEASFDFPGFDRFLQPWSNWKSRLAEQHGLRIGLDYQPVAQWADNSLGEDSAVGGIFRAFLSWDMWGRGNPSRKGSFDIRVEYRHRIGTELPPESLAPNFGWIGTTAPDWSDQGLGLPVFYLRQRLDIGDAPIEINIGRISPFAQFDITPYSDNLTGFQNNSIILNPTIAYPSAGSLGIAGYFGLPRSKFYALGMILDANGAYDELGLDSLEQGEYFSALEFGWTDQGLSSQSFLFNNVHFALWHNDKAGHGVALTGTYTFTDRRIGVFGRLGLASNDASTIYRKYAGGGLEIGVLRASTFGLGASWGQPVNSDDSQVAAELFYKWQLSQNLALTPSVQFLFNPVLNPVDNNVLVFGLRLRITL